MQASNTKDPTMILYGSQYTAIKILSDANKGILLDALFRYILNEEEKDNILQEIASEGVRITFLLLTNQIDLDKKKYAEKCATNKRIAEEREQHKRQRTYTNVSGRSPKDKDNDNDNDNDNDIVVVDAASNDALRKRCYKFYDALVPYVATYGKDMVRKFYDYWTEPNKSKTKMRFELERTWDLKRRLNTWASRERVDSNDTQKQKRQNDAAAIIARLAAEDDYREENKY